MSSCETGTNNDGKSVVDMEEHGVLSSYYLLSKIHNEMKEYGMPKDK